MRNDIDYNKENLIERLKNRYKLKKNMDVCNVLRENSLCATVFYVEEKDIWQIALHKFYGFDVVLTSLEFYVDNNWNVVDENQHVMINFPSSLDEYMEKRIKKIKSFRISDKMR